MRQVRWLTLLVLAASLSPSWRQAAASEQLKLIRPEQYQARIVAPRRGRVLLVQFFQTDSDACRGQLGDLKTVGARFSRNDLAVFLVSVDAKRTATSDVPQFLARERIPFVCFLMKTHDPHLFFQAVSPGWRGGVPFAVVYGRDGRIAAQLTGRQSLAALSDAIASALSPAPARAR